MIARARSARRASARRAPTRTGAALLLAALATAHGAQAAPQWNAALNPAGCLLGDDSNLFDRAAFCGSLRGDVLFFRHRARDWGLGPYFSAGSAAFEDLRLSLGASALVPVVEDFPLVISLGPLLRDGRHPGVSAQLFGGVRSYNFHGSYNLAFGATLGFERDFSADARNVLSVGLHVDAFVLALPILLLSGALR